MTADWTGVNRDFDNDAEQYPNRCCSCHKWFVGNRNRVDCAVCEPSPLVPDPNQLELPLPSRGT